MMIDMKQVERDELLIRLDEHMLDIKRDIKTINHILFGNGKEGMCYTMVKHKVYFALMGTALCILAGCLLNILF